MRSRGSRPSSPPPTERGPLRVLQLIGDTDGLPAHRRALAAHRSLMSEGLEVRTLALTTGATAELADVVPVLAPSRRGPAARGAVRSESAWADAVVLRGARCLAPATSRKPASVPPLLIDLSDGLPEDGLARRTARRVVASADVVVVADGLDRAAVLDRVGLAPTSVVQLDGHDPTDVWIELLRSVTAGARDPGGG